MSSLSRRLFLGTSLAGLTASTLYGKDSASSKGVELPPVMELPPFQPDTLFLTWQRDPTTTMTVQWVGTVGETDDPTIYYSTEPEGPWSRVETVRRPYGVTDLKVFRAELTKLTPGTDYHFRIGKMSPRYRFRTMPSKATNAISFISGGDVGVNSHSIANNIQAARQDPMFAVIGGDLGYDNGKSVATSLAFVRNYSKHMVTRQGHMIPMIAALGNHEVDGGYLQPREKAPFFFALFDGLYPETSYQTLDFGDYLSLVLLDTAHISEIGGAQASWLHDILKARVDHPNVMVVNHVPAYPSFRLSKADGTGTGSGNREHWTPLFDKYRVPIVLEHHDHTFKRTKPMLDGMPHKDGVLYLGDGSWGRLRAPKGLAELPYLSATSEDYHLSLHRIEGDERFHLAMDEFGRVMDVTRTGQRATGAVSLSAPRTRLSSDTLWTAAAHS
ncbi:fibronectin type III domain-containing protein [Planctomicrobium sp. SH664]|uniref:fibronectin type III domain-containing protein n=1 Tax=Planctomicrobium sp. SH664 TaxID=3448125 RepID=UPI003F5BCA7B